LLYKYHKLENNQMLIHPVEDVYTGGRIDYKVQKKYVCSRVHIRFLEAWEVSVLPKRRKSPSKLPDR